MSVKKIFVTLITIVACVAIGALVLNLLLPTVASTLVNATEDMIFNATKLSFDFNKDGDVGGATATTYNTGAGDATENQNTNVGVAGFN